MAGLCKDRWAGVYLSTVQHIEFPEEVSEDYNWVLTDLLIQEAGEFIYLFFPPISMSR